MRKILLILLLIFTFSLFACGKTEEQPNNPTVETPKEETKIEPTEEVEERKQIYQLAVSSGYTGTYEEWLASIKGDEIILQVSNGFIQWKYSKSNVWTNLISLNELAGKDGSNGLDGKNVEFNVDGNYIKWRYVGDSSWQNLLSLDTITGSDGKTPEMRVNDGFIQWKYADEATWTNLVELSTVNGKDGLTPEFKATETHLLWKYTIESDSEWKELLDLDSLKGSDGQDGAPGEDGKDGIDGAPGEDGKDGLDGKTPEFRIHEGYLEWKYTDESEWKQLFALEDLKGEDGQDGIDGAPGEDGKDGIDGAPGEDGKDGLDGKTPEFRIHEGYLEWKYTTESEWKKLLSLTDIEGSDGENGDKGEDGKTPEFRVNEGYLEWKYIDDSEWTKLYSINDLVGSSGNDGLSAYELYCKYHPEYKGTEEEWINEILLGNSSNQPLKQITVTFDSNGGCEVESQVLNFGDTITKPIDPVRPGYYFDGWVLKEALESGDEDYIVPWNFYYNSVFKDTTLVACWSINPYEQFQLNFTEEEWINAFDYSNVTIVYEDDNSSSQIAYIKSVDGNTYLYDEYGKIWGCIDKYSSDFASYYKLIDYIDFYDLVESYNGEYCYLEVPAHTEENCTFGRKAKVYFDKNKQITRIYVELDIHGYISRCYDVKFYDYGTTVAPEVIIHDSSSYTEYKNDHYYVIETCNICNDVNEYIYGHELETVNKTYEDTLSATGYCTKCQEEVTVELDKTLSDMIYEVKENSAWSYYYEDLGDGYEYHHYYNYACNYSYIVETYYGSTWRETVVNNEHMIQYNPYENTYVYGKDESYLDYWGDYDIAIIEPLYEKFYNFIPMYSEAISSSNDGTYYFTTYDIPTIEEAYGCTVEEYLSGSGLEPVENYYMTIVFGYDGLSINYPRYAIPTTSGVYTGHFGIERKFYSLEDFENEFWYIVESFENLYGLLTNPNARWEKMDYSSHDDYIYREVGTQLKVKGVVTHINQISDGRVSYFIQNETEGFYIYGQDATLYPVELGKVYEVGGYKGDFRGLNEIINVEYCVQLDEYISYETIDLTYSCPNDYYQMLEYQGNLVYATGTFVSGYVSEKAFNILVNINGYETVLRIDPFYTGESEFNALCEIINNAMSGSPIEFYGYMSAYNNEVQIQITSSKQFNITEPSADKVLQDCLNNIYIEQYYDADAINIYLPTSVVGYDGVEITWSTDSDYIDINNQTVTHTDTVIEATLYVTLTYQGEQLQGSFDINISAKRVYAQIQTKVEGMSIAILDDEGNIASYVSVGDYAPIGAKIGVQPTTLHGEEITIVTFNGAPYTAIINDLYCFVVPDVEYLQIEATIKQPTTYSVVSYQETENGTFEVKYFESPANPTLYYVANGDEIEAGKYLAITATANEGYNPIIKVNGKEAINIIAGYYCFPIDSAQSIVTVDFYKILTVAEAIATNVDETIVVEGIVGPSLVNQTGFYLIDETGVIALRMAVDEFNNFSQGNHVVIIGTRAQFKSSDTLAGQSTVVDAELVYNYYGKHEYSTATFKTTTLADIAGLLDLTMNDYTNQVYIVEASIYSEKFTNMIENDQDSIFIYCSGADQVAWAVEAADGQVVKMEIALCNWNARSPYKCAILAIYLEDGSKIVNPYNFEYYSE